MKKDKLLKNWLFVSIISSIAAFISILVLIRGIDLYFVKSWQLAFLISIITFIIVVTHNPKFIFIKVFYFMISVFMIINKFYFKIEGSFNLFNFEFGSSRTETIVNVVILAIAAVSLFFFYLESHNLKFNGIIGNIKIFQAREQVIIKGSTFNNYNDSHHTDQHPEDIELRLIKSIKKLHTKIQNPIDTEDINKIQNRYKRVKKKNIELKLSIPDDIAKLVADYLDSDFQEFKKKVLDGDKEEIYELLIKKIL